MCSSRCDTPISSAPLVHRRRRTQAPNDTDRTPGICSESTVSPLDRTVPAKRGVGARRRCGSRPVRASRRGGRPPRRPPRSPRSSRSAGGAPAPSPAAGAASSGMPSGFGSSAFIDRRRRPRSSRSMSLTFTRSPFLTTSSVFSVRPWRISEMWSRPSVPGMISTNAPNAVVALHRAFVGLADHRLGGDGLDHLARALHRLAAHGGDRHQAGVVHGELGARLVLDAADRLALGADEVADLLGVDAHRDDARRVRRQLGARRASALSISPRMCRRPSLAPARAPPS